MGLFGKLKLIVTLGILLAGGIVGVLGKDIVNAGVTDYSIDRIRSVDSSGFNVDLSVTVINPSKLTINVDRIDYTAVLRDTGEVVARGTLKGVELPKNESTEIELSPRINWVPSTNLAIQYATQEKVWMDIELDVILYKFLPSVSVTVPVDIKEVFQEGNGGVIGIPEDDEDNGLLNL